MLNESQLEIRPTGIGASEIPAVATLSPFSSPLDVWLRKGTPNRPAIDMFTGSTATEVGEFLEPALFKLYKHRTGRAAARQLGKTFRHSKYPFILSSPDGYTDDGRLVEIKVVGSGMIKAWQDGVPDYVVAQVQQQMAVAEREVCDVVMLHGTDCQILPVPFDAELWFSLEAMAVEFWTQYVEKDIPPPPSPREDYREYLAKRFPNSNAALRPVPQELENDMHDAAQRFQSIGEEIKLLEAQRGVYEGILKENIGEFGGLMGDGWKATWASQRGNPSWKQIAEALAPGGVPEDVIEANRGKAFRKFSVKI